MGKKERKGREERETMQSRMMTMFTIMVAAMALVAAPACAQEEIPAVIPENSIAGTAIGVEDLSTLVEAIVLTSEEREGDQANLLEVLSDPEAEFTVFAPINEAFETALAAFGLESNADASQAGRYLVLTNHVVPGVFAAEDLSDGQVLEALSGLPLVVDIIGESVYINATDSSAMVLVTDVPAGNSLVHVIDAVLLPFSPSDFAPTPEPEEEGEGDSIASVAASESELSILVEAVVAGGLLDAVAAPAAELTVFAPINQAFLDLLDAIGAEGLDDIPTDLLVDVLTYHVVPAVAFAEDLSDGQVLPTLNGEELTVSIVLDEVFIEGIGSTAEVIVADIEAGNSVVHVIDAVLLPFATDTEPEEAPTEEESIASVAASVPDLSILVEAVVAGGLLDAIADPAAELTVFAPTNDAFVELLGALGAEGLDDIPVETLVEVLTYHVVPAVAFAEDLSDGQVLPTLNGAELVVDLTSGVVIDGIGSDATVVNADVAAGLSVVHVIDTVLLPFGGDDDECALDLFPCGDPDDGSGCCSGICRGSFFFFPFYRFCSPI